MRGEWYRVYVRGICGMAFTGCNTVLRRQADEKYKDKFYVP